VHVLWIKTDLLFPLNSGGRIRTFEMLRAIRRRHEVTYVALDDGTATPEALEHAREYATRVDLVPHHAPAKGTPAFFAAMLANLGSPDPYVIDRYRSPAMAKRIRHWCAQGDVDLLVCDFIFPAPAVPRSAPIPRIIFQHNVEARIWARHAAVGRTALHRAYFALQHRRMRRAEAALCARFDGVVAVSESDADEFRSAYALAEVESVPTGVNTEFFQTTDPATREPGHLLFLGAMDWMPNADGIRWFVKEVLPIVQRSEPTVRLTIVGRDPVASVRELHAPEQGVVVTGTVPDVRPWLASAAVFVVPLRVGGGTRLKLYEGLATGIPTVSTTIGAEGLPLEDGVHLRVTDAPQAMADAIVSLVRDPAAAARMGAAAARYVRGTFGWDGVAQQFVDACIRLGARSPRRDGDPVGARV
jgi:glycosyltransferase involved in cell wall biosynthesis